MSVEAGFLKGIADHPAERATQLAYADWLDEQGRAAEAEFLKAQIQVAELSARLIELGGQIGTEWLTAVRNVPVKQRHQLVLRSGRDVDFDELRQRLTYPDFMMGAPSNPAYNQHIVDAAVAIEEERIGRRPYLVPPVEIPVSRGRRLLPGHVCVATLSSFDLSDEESQGVFDVTKTTLTVVWFQSEWAFPIDPAVYEQIRSIDWDTHASRIDR